MVRRTGPFLSLALLASLVAGMAAPAAPLRAQAQPVPQTSAKPGWKWSIDSVRSVVSEVRAG
ncbi:MAG: hypothetical protein EBV77_08125, partial [Gemmatimonadaceae bacterium]|nr:hypothetical protein [Gemmatimonadaceae bacterium]